MHELVGKKLTLYGILNQRFIDSIASRLNMSSKDITEDIIREYLLNNSSSTGLTTVIFGEQ